MVKYVYLIGIAGNIGSATVASSIAMKKGLLKERYGMITKTKNFENMKLIDEKEFEFIGCDIRNRNIYESLLDNEILPHKILDKIFEDNKKIPIRKAISFQDISKILDSNNTYNVKNLKEVLDILVKEIKDVKNRYGDLIAVDIMSTESFIPICKEHSDLDKFIKLIEEDRKDLITPSMLYAYAFIKEGCPFIEFTPNLSIVPKAIQDLAVEKRIPICGKDASTGQTFYKTVIAEILKKRNLKIVGWYSTNLLGNNDGKILNLENHLKTKIEDKYNPLNSVLEYNPCHIIDIRYYPPKGDNKEAWDNVDFIGWFNMPMSMKINWIGRDTILAVPLLFDLLRLVEFSQRKGEYGILEHLAVFFKNPIGSKEKSFLENYKVLEEYARKNSED